MTNLWVIDHRHRTLESVREDVRLPKNTTRAAVSPKRQQCGPTWPSQPTLGANFDLAPFGAFAPLAVLLFFDGCDPLLALLAELASVGVAGPAPESVDFAFLHVARLLPCCPHAVHTIWSGDA